MLKRNFSTISIILLTLMRCATPMAGAFPIDVTSSAAAVPVKASQPTFYSATLSVAANQAGPAVNRLITGNNIQWVDNADGIFTATGSTLTFAQPQVARLSALGMGVLRYPGGTLADLYHWQAGIGPLASRGMATTAAIVGGSAISQTVRVGTQEFLELCETTGAQPLITVNVMTGSAQEAADWVAYTNKQDLISSKTGRVLPKVRYWEIGNEPYLQDPALTGHWISAADYAQAASRYIVAMKAVDSSIQVGIPLRSDSVGGVAATPYPGWNETVLRALQSQTPGFDYAAVHNAYFPYAAQTYTDADLFAASMAATPVLSSDLAATQTQLKRYFPSRNIPLAITEFNSFYGSSGAQANDVATLGGALYVADALAVMAKRDDILLANFWSAAGNAMFGALDASGQLRPAYDVLQYFSQMQQGNQLPVTVQAPFLPSNAAVGAVPAQSKVPSLTAYATLSGNVAHFMLINKDAQSTANLSLSLGQTPASVSYRQLSTAAVFDAASALQRSNGVLPASATVQYSLPAHAIVFLEVTLNDTSVFSSTSADCLFDWAARQLPAQFAPAQSRSQSSAPYYYRYFPQTDNYLGVILGTGNLFYFKAGVGLLDVSALGQQAMVASGCK